MSAANVLTGQDVGRCSFPMIGATDVEVQVGSYVDQVWTSVASARGAVVADRETTIRMIIPDP